MISEKNKIEIFDFSADIFLYPDENWFKKLNIIKNIVKNNYKLTLPSQSLSEVQSIFINYFDLNSKKFNVVPIASYWIDSKMMSISTIKINKFYNSCNYKVDSFGPPDHISKMLSFCAILLEDNKIKEFNKFKKWLYWLKDFSISVGKNIPIKCFAEISNICYLLSKEECEV